MPIFDATFERHCLAVPNNVFFFTAIFSILLVITNIPGNLLVILAVAIDPHKNLRVPFNYLMTNLAVADLLAGAVAGSLAIKYHLMEGLDERTSLTQIRIFDMTYFVASTASVLSLAALAIERYHAICDPYSSNKKFSGKRILMTIVFIWSISLTLPFLYFQVGFITYSFIFANTTVIVAVGITCFTYALMLHKFKQHTKNTRASTSSSTYNSIDNLPIAWKPAPPRRRHDVQWEHKLTKMFLVVMVALLCCYGPSTILIYVMSLCESCGCTTLHWFRDLEFLFVVLNSSVNFFCYALRSPRFRSAFAHILRFKKRSEGDRAWVANNQMLPSFA